MMYDAREWGMYTQNWSHLQPGGVNMEWQIYLQQTEYNLNSLPVLHVFILSILLIPIDFTMKSVTRTALEEGWAMLLGGGGGGGGGGGRFQIKK